MGQKVHPTAIRLGIVESHRSTWYANSKNYADMLHSDIKIREFIRDQLKNAFVGRIEVERPGKEARVVIHSARPGMVIGKKGDDIEKLRAKLTQLSGIPVHIGIEEIRRPELDARLVADSVAQQLERRVMFRRAMKRAVSNALRLGAEGIKICVAGRLGGAEIARTEWYREGRVPLHTFRANIDYSTAEASTTYGIIGVKVWIFKGEVIGKPALASESTAAVEQQQQ